jgi:outer membrane protein OmpA-like peptidoglycan-associated protein
MKNFTITLTIFFLSLLIFQAQAQDVSSIRQHAFSKAFVFTGEGGLTLSLTDYQKSGTGLSTRLSGEYFFPTSSVHSFALGLRLGYLKITGDDNRSSISTKDFPNQQIPPTFNTQAYSVGLGVIYLISIGDVFFPQASFGFSNLWFDPKDDQGNPAYGNSLGIYSKSTQVFNLDLGFRILAVDKLSFNASAGINVSLSDYLDDVAAAGKNDSYLTFMFGISYSPFSNADPDGDGIKGSDDLCPDQPEDFDGFQDEDGCPDFDNDGDGIPDISDKCPDQIEDFDGFQDDDGCPDPDNDGDGIEDAFDKCPNQAEDFDGFADLDGCPDYDNDGDNIPDSVDNCPNEPETLNGINDDDGCPDSIVTELPSRFILSADEIFSQNSSQIKYEAKGLLNNIINILSKYPGFDWRIEGHMDTEGSENYMRTLSFERAKAVLEYLSTSGGLDKANFEIFGMGDKFPIGNNNTEEGRKQNRRIEIIKIE